MSSHSRPTGSECAPWPQLLQSKLSSNRLTQSTGNGNMNKNTQIINTNGQSQTESEITTSNKFSSSHSLPPSPRQVLVADHLVAQESDLPNLLRQKQLGCLKLVRVREGKKEEKSSQNDNEQSNSKNNCCSVAAESLLLEGRQSLSLQSRVRRDCSDRLLDRWPQWGASGLWDRLQHKSQASESNYQ